jgi:hypothetical protein
MQTGKQPWWSRVWFAEPGPIARVGLVLLMVAAFAAIGWFAGDMPSGRADSRGGEGLNGAIAFGSLGAIGGAWALWRWDKR